MKITNVALWATIAALGAVSAGCGEPPKQPAPANTNAAAPGGNASQADSTIVKDEPGQEAVDRGRTVELVTVPV